MYISHAYLNDPWTNTCRLVSRRGTYFWAGQSCMCNAYEWGVESVRKKAKRTHYVERVWKYERVFEPHRTREYGSFSRRPRALFASLATTALSHTHRSWCGLHGVEAAFTSQLLPFDIVTMRPLAPLQRWERYAYTTFWCIPERERLHSWVWQVAFLKRDTTPLQPRAHTARLVASC